MESLWEGGALWGPCGEAHERRVGDLWDVCGGGWGAVGVCEEPLRGLCGGLCGGLWEEEGV